jgi:hypothetical protein
LLDLARWLSGNIIRLGNDVIRLIRLGDDIIRLIKLGGNIIRLSVEHYENLGLLGHYI